MRNTIYPTMDALRYFRINALFLALVVPMFLLGFLFANAQEEIEQQEEAAQELVDQDENITPQDLGVDDPSVLPGNPLYIFKGIGRTFQSLTTRDPAAKAELKLKIAKKKINEAKKKTEKNNNT